MFKNSSILVVTILNSERKLNWLSFLRKNINKRQLNNNTNNNNLDELILILEKIIYKSGYSDHWRFSLRKSSKNYPKEGFTRNVAAINLFLKRQRRKQKKKHNNKIDTLLFYNIKS